MGENSKIQWTDHTFNPWIGCTKVSPACDHCYAETYAKRVGMGEWGGPRRHTAPANWKLPLKWNAAAEKAGVRHRVFCASMADVFDNQVPDEWRTELWALIGRCRSLDWLLLTKRIGNAAKMLPGEKAMPNAWLGISVGNQPEADRDVPKVVRVPAAVHFVSYEPALAFIDWREHLSRSPRPNWIIVGGESGPKARPFDLAWARSTIAQCRAAGVAVFVKQLGAKPVYRALPPFEGAQLLLNDGGSLRDRKGGDMAEWPEDLRVREWPKG